MYNQQKLCCLKLRRIVVLAAIVGSILVWASNVLATQNAKFLMSATSRNEPLPRPIVEKVTWMDKEYDLTEGMNVLMSAVQSSSTSPDVKHYALSKLSMLRGALNGSDALASLVSLYKENTQVGKRGILLCLNAAYDARAIPLFNHVLDTELDVELRLSAAVGLAQWNVRRGVAELVQFLESDVALREPNRSGTVKQYALEMIRAKNKIKEWGLPQDDWWEALDNRGDLDRTQKQALYEGGIEKDIKGIKEWWSRNQERFPDWKPGDTLPEVESDR